MSAGDAQIHSQKVCPSRCCLVIAGHSWASPWTVPCQMSSQLSSLIKRSLGEVVRLLYLSTLRKTMAVDIKLKVSSPGSENHTWTRTLFWTLRYTFLGNHFSGKVSGDLGYSFVMARACRTSSNRIICPICEGGDFTYFVNCIMCDCI